MSKAAARDVIADKVRPYTFNDKEPPMIADAILSALRAAGLVVVPVEPTAEMIAACGEAAQDTLTEISMKYVFAEAKVHVTGSFDGAAVWRAMIAASQEDKDERRSGTGEAVA